MLTVLVQLLALIQYLLTLQSRNRSINLTTIDRSIEVLTYTRKKPLSRFTQYIKRSVRYAYSSK